MELFGEMSNWDNFRVLFYCTCLFSFIGLVASAGDLVKAWGSSVYAMIVVTTLLAIVFMFFAGVVFLR